MTSTWLFVIATLFLQEPASSDAAIFQVRQLHFNLWLVNGLWILATIIDIALGYALGKWLQRRFKGSRVVLWAGKWASRIEEFIGKKGEQFAIVLIGVVNFPWMNAFVFSWLTLPFKNIFVLLFIGDAIYWAIEWGINIGVRSVVPNSHAALYIVVGLGLVLSIVSKVALDTLLKNRT